MYSEVDLQREPLPGYRLTDRLGAGGYGEVWRAEAPGGLKKAIKFVFGDQHERRAIRELRSLELIKQLRHPFLLSLERIEVVDGRLLIVTELADGSVKDRFDACCQESKPGIPRDELLGYLRDAADALDYMSDTHGLQHLDIKPENLLLVARRVKVADFGLVKDVKQSEASLVGGMTPMYAAPEVFRGQPSRQSDQYALAIVYQEMLTGQLPFAGSNAAELTLQHLNDEPDLASMSSADRYVVSRALSKDPTHRYASCREFIDTLLKISTEVATSGAAEQAAPGEWRAASVSRPNTPTELFDDDAAMENRASLLIDAPVRDRSVIDLPPVSVAVGSFCPTPTLILGIGGTAGQVLRHLRAGIREQLGDAPLPALQTLLIDTDSKALAAVSADGMAHDAWSSHGLGSEETVHVPLRRPQHYRDRWDQLLSWLSRRWLYNIPKSLRTEGLRPLGRLAFVDHARQTCQRIRKAMLQAIERDAVDASAGAFGRELRRDTLRVYVVASISGGTGSGMALDAAYAVRTLLKKLDLPTATVIGILAHSTPRDPRQSQLARVNAFSWLTEFQHYHQAGGEYPGDASCGLPAHPPGTAAFDHTYFVHLGDGLGQEEFDRAAQSVADYLRLDALSPAQLVLDACRQSASSAGLTEDGQVGVRLRSFGTLRRQTAPSGFCDEMAATACSRIFNAWRTADPGKASAEQTDTANLANLVRRLKLTSAGIAANTRMLIEARLGSDAAAFIAQWLTDRGLSIHDQSTAGGDGRLLAAVDELFGGAQGESGQLQSTLLGQPVVDLIDPLADKLRDEIRRWVLRQLDDPQQRLTGAGRGVQSLANVVQVTQQEARQFGRIVVDSLLQLRSTNSSTDAADDNQATTDAMDGDAPSAIRYFQLRLDQLALSAVEHVCRLIQSEMKTIREQLTTFGRELSQMTQAAANYVGGDATATTPPPAANETGATEFVRSHLSEIAACVDVRVQAEYLEQHGGLYQTVMQGGRPRAQLGATMQEFARQAIQKTMVRSEISGSAMCGSERELQRDVNAATPLVLQHGGARRVLAVMPAEAAAQCDVDELSQLAGTSVSVVTGASDGLTICVEAEQLSLAEIAVEIIQRRRDSVEFAKRVQTRADVCWRPLLPPEAPAEASANRGTTTWPIVADHSLNATEVISDIPTGP